MSTKFITIRQVKEIRELRKQRFTYREIAEMLGISYWSVSKYATERNTEETLRKDRERYQINRGGRREKQRAAYERRRAIKRKAISGPFYVKENRNVPPEKRERWIKGHTAYAKKLGASWMRVSYHPDNENRMIFEAWYECPEDQGPVRWKDAT